MKSLQKARGRRYDFPAAMSIHIYIHIYICIPTISLLQPVATGWSMSRDAMKIRPLCEKYSKQRFVCNLNDTTINEIEIKYIRWIGYLQWFSFKVRFLLTMGQFCNDLCNRSMNSKWNVLGCNRLSLAVHKCNLSHNYHWWHYYKWEYLPVYLEIKSV